MGNLGKTISYLKRNGLKDTCHTIRERLDGSHLEQIQRELADYEGARFFADGLRQAHADEVRKEQAERRFRDEYLFSILVPAYETQEVYLKEMIDSVMRQTYAKVELIVADASQSDRVERVVEEYREYDLPIIRRANEAYQTSYGQEYPVIRYIRLEKNEGISANTNRALDAAKGDYIGLLDHDDVLTYDALYEVMEKLEKVPAEMVYTDEDKADGEMKAFHTPHVKPDFNLAYLLCNNYICHFTVMRAQLMRRLRFRPEYDGAQDYDLFLRAVTELGSTPAEDGSRQWIPKLSVALKARIAHVDRIVYHWRCHESSTAANPESKRYAYEAGRRALEEFCRNHRIDAEVAHSKHLGYYRLVEKSDVWGNYPDVAAFCGCIIAQRQIMAGPKLGGRQLFAGLLAGYSGYMNRADFPLEVDAADERVTVFQRSYQDLFKRMEQNGQQLSFAEKLEYIKEQGACLLYVPDDTVRGKKIARRRTGDRM